MGRTQKSDGGKCLPNAHRRWRSLWTGRNKTATTHYVLLIASYTRKISSPTCLYVKLSLRYGRVVAVVFLDQLIPTKSLLWWHKRQEIHNLIYRLNAFMTICLQLRSVPSLVGLPNKRSPTTDGASFCTVSRRKHFLLAETTAQAINSSSPKFGTICWSLYGYIASNVEIFQIWFNDSCTSFS